MPSNHFIALKVEFLNKKVFHFRVGHQRFPHIYMRKIFDKQLENGIIGEIKVHPSNYSRYTWIPHNEPLNTCLILVVNCSGIRH